MRIGCLFTCLVVTGATTPLFIWGSSSHFSGSECSRVDTITSTLSANDLTNGVRGVLEGKQASMGSELVNKDSAKPATVLSFVVDGLTTPQAAQLLGAYSTSPVEPPSSLAFVQKALDSSTSCVSAPFLRTEQPVATVLANAAPTGTTLLVARVEKGDNCDDVVSMLKTKTSAGSEANLIIVQVADVSAIEGQCMETISNLLKAVTQDKFVVTFSGQSGDAPKRRLLEGRVLAASTVTGVLYTGPTMVFGIFFMWFFFFFVYIAISCMMSIETPNRFASKGLVIAKEY